MAGEWKRSANRASSSEGRMEEPRTGGCGGPKFGTDCTDYNNKNEMIHITLYLRAFVFEMKGTPRKTQNNSIIKQNLHKRGHKS